MVDICRVCGNDNDGPAQCCCQPQVTQAQFQAQKVKNAAFSILQAVEGKDCLREGLKDTPDRVAKAWAHWAGGYDIDPQSLLKSFEDGAEGYGEMVIVKDIPFYSKCEHHLADIFGTATVAYIPNGRVVGLSKLSRLVDCFARRLQVQERMTCQIAEALYTSDLAPSFVGVYVKARHMCMESRGLCQQGHHTITQQILGQGRPNYEAYRFEFLEIARG